MTEDERRRLIEAAVQGIAWSLIEYDTDTSDRGVAREHYAQRVADARRLLPMIAVDPPECVCYSTREDHCRAHELEAIDLS